MDLQADKQSIIKWLEGIDDSQIIMQFKSLQKSNQKQIDSPLTSAEKTAIDQGLNSIDKGKIHTHESVMQSSREKYPKLFR